MNTAVCFTRGLAALAFAFAVSLTAVPHARADVRAAPAAPSGPAVPPSAAPAVARTGLAVLAVGDSAELAWPLAQKVYATDTLRPRVVDEARARTLAGDPVSADAPADIKELAELRSAVRGDDPASRAVLASIAERLALRGVILVEGGADSAPTARVFIAEGGQIDAARYAPDARGQAGAPTLWDGAVASLARTYGPRVSSSVLAGPTSATAASTAASTAARRAETSTSSPFYTSGWFWGAIGAAALGVGAVYLATRDNDPGTIHLQMQVPK